MFSFFAAETVLTFSCHVPQ